MLAMTIDDTEAPFSSAQSALKFAYNFSPAQYAPSVMGRLISGGRLGRGSGLVGVDGAAQAGMILAEVRLLGALVEAFIAARFAPHHVPCACRQACCTGYRPTPAFTHGIYAITHAALDVLGDCSVNYRLRRGLVLRYFGERENMTELAKFAGVNRDTASQHNARLLPWLKHHDGASLHKCVYRLKEVGMVE